MKLTDLCREDRILIPLMSKIRDEVLQEMVQPLQRQGIIKNADEILGLLQDRERQLTTAIGNGVAIPHTRPLEVPEPLLVFGRTAVPVDFQALDGQLVRLVFLLITPKGNISLHLKLLSRISRLMNSADLRQALIEAHNAAEVIARLRAAEEDYFDLTT